MNVPATRKFHSLIKGFILTLIIANIIAWTLVVANAWAYMPNPMPKPPVAVKFNGGRATGPVAVSHLTLSRLFAGYNPFMYSYKYWNGHEWIICNVYWDGEVCGIAR